MQPVASTDLKPRLTGILWGDSKVGKTTYAMTLPGRKLVFNFDPDGFSSVAGRKDFDVFDFSQAAPSEAIEQARKAAAFIVSKDCNGYTSVIVDSMTTLAEVSLLDAIHRGVGKSSSFQPTIDAPGLAGYGARNNNFNDVISRILRATSQRGLNCFFIAHSDDPEYDKEGKNIVQQTIMLSAKMRNTAGLKASEIWHMALSPTGKRTVYLAPFGVKRPMGSRIFNTSAFDKFELRYDPDQPDEAQADTLCSIIDAWHGGKMARLTALPRPKDAKPL